MTAFTLTARSLEDRLQQAAMEGLEANFARWLRFVGAPPGEWLELQALKVPTRYGTRNRFAHADALAAALPLLRQAETFSAQGVFLIANRVNPAVATRSTPRTWHDAEKGASTTDRDVSHRRVLFVDVDALRTSGTSATDDEMARTVPIAGAVFARLADLLGEGALGYAHSGNGRQIFVAIEPTDEPSALTVITKGSSPRSASPSLRPARRSTGRSPTRSVSCRRSAPPRGREPVTWRSDPTAAPPSLARKR